MTVINVNASKNYDVIIDRGILKDAGEYIKKVISPCNVLIVTDDIVKGSYCRTVKSSLEKEGFTVYEYTIKHGEASKNTDEFVSILNTLAELKFTRTDMIAALGGGVVGDLAGFAAAVYLRGIRFVQIPTTLLAAVDSSVGGKTAVDLAQGKNLVGAFYQPELVLCDFATHSTLEKSVFTDGCAEVIKYGMICDLNLFHELKSGINDSNCEKIISRCVEIKRDIVCEDEHDTGIRQLLNFGHTFAHSIEKLSGYETPHGSAVAMGMMIITAQSVKNNMCSKQCVEALEHMLKQYDLPHNQRPYSAEDMFEAALSDKKRAANGITLVIPEEIGKCVLKKMTIAQLKEFICS